MSIDPATLGFHSQRTAFTYDWKTAALYALGIGARKDELGYLYEGLGPKVYPTFAVVPVMAAVRECLEKTGGNPAMILHGAQSVRIKAPMPPAGELFTTASITGIYDMKKLTQVAVETDTRTAAGESLFETGWSILYRDGGFPGGAHPPKTSEPDIPKDRTPDFEIALATTPEQALLYRLSGDTNPLHADPEFAKVAGFAEGPILHGLCTYGFVARAVIAGACENDGSRLERLDVQFRRPVWPGDTIVTAGWRLDGGGVALAVSVKERPGAVLTGAWAQLRRPG
jgi:acyl dehydratase